jgi:hypothetical protein
MEDVTREALKQSRRRMFAAYSDVISNGHNMTPDEISDRLLAASNTAEAKPVGHVDMQTPGPGDRIRWTNGALPHGAPLYAALPAPMDAQPTDNAQYNAGFVAGQRYAEKHLAQPVSGALDEREALRKILVSIVPAQMKEKHPFDFMMSDECDREKHRGEVAGWNNCRKAVMDAADTAYRAALNQVEAQPNAAQAEKDAARYRYMRNSAAFQDRNGPGLYWYLPRYMTGSAAERLDAVIDAAMSAQPNPNN